jgi:hypothetical protein
MTGQTADISHVCEVPWYAWVLFHESRTQFPEVKLVLGQYLGPTDPGVVLTMSAKILKANGEVVRRNTFCLLRTEEFDTEENKRMRNEYDASVAIPLGQALENENLVTPALQISTITPEYKIYEDEQNVPKLTIELDDVAVHSDPSSYDGYIASQVLLPRDDWEQL